MHRPALTPSLNLIKSFGVCRLLRFMQTIVDSDTPNDLFDYVLSCLDDAGNDAIANAIISMYHRCLDVIPIDVRVIYY